LKYCVVRKHRERLSSFLILQKINIIIEWN
jgi:hypothetical protein